MSHLPVSIMAELSDEQQQHVVLKCAQAVSDLCSTHVVQVLKNCPHRNLCPLYANCRMFTWR